MKNIVYFLICESYFLTHEHFFETVQFWKLFKLKKFKFEKNEKYKTLKNEKGSKIKNVQIQQ
jgi:hypothetical protein